MKKKLFLLFAFILCLFISVNTVNSESEKDILKSVTLDTQSKDFYIGDKISFTVETTEEISSMSVNFYNPVDNGDGYYAYFTVDLTGECSFSNKTVCTFSGYIPETIKGYYVTAEKEQKEMVIYSGLYRLDSIFIYDKKGNLIRYTTNKEYADSSEFLYYSQKIEINIDKSIRDILKSVALDAESKDFYIGDKISFTVETAEEINSMSINFYNPISEDGHGYGYFTVELTSECSSSNKVKCTFSGYIPKTLAGYSSTTENGRSEMTIYPGAYEVNSIFVYNKKGNLIRYTTNKEYADSSEFLYYPQKAIINVKEPTADELNDVNFVLDELELKNKTSGIGKQVFLDLKYSYNDSNKKIKSIYLIFRGVNQNKVFTTYIKSLFSNPSFIVASSADLSTYRLDSIGVTFEAVDGTNNTIIINGNTNSGRYSEIFSQNLTITEYASDDKLYFSAYELNEEIYKRIQNSNDDSIIIDADDYTIIPFELFNTIKDSEKDLVIRYNNNEWIFKGVDINNPKNIDVLIKIYEINASSISDNLKKALSGETVILEFPNNGELPGNVLIRIKNQELISKLKCDKYYIYYADTENEKLSKVALDVEKTSDGYIQFYISHNSKYVISSKEIEDQTIIGEDDSLLAKNTVLNEEIVTLNRNKKPLLLYSLIVIVSALIVIAFIVTIVKRHSEINNKKIKD